MKHNVSVIHDCYGCGVCAVSCPTKIIDIRLNADGFYEPVVFDQERCIDCGMCLRVCSYNHGDELALENPDIRSYAGWSNDETNRRECSSGGVGYEVALSAVEEGRTVCAVKYDARLGKAVHYLSTTPDELRASKGSKYMQSMTLPALAEIDKKKRNVVVGTPCQIDSYRRYLKILKKEDNFLLVDFFCHGVPSMLLWNKYLRQAESELGPVKNVVWRDKTTGWHDSYAMNVVGESGKRFLRHWTKGDIFYAFFLGDCCLGKQCYERCKFKLANSSADIRLGDQWGPTYRGNDEGVSAVISFTPKGEEALRSANITLQPQPVEVVTEGQQKRMARKDWRYALTMKLLKSDLPMDRVVSRYRCALKWHGRLEYFKNPKKLIEKLTGK